MSITLSSCECHHWSACTKENHQHQDQDQDQDQDQRERREGPNGGVCVIDERTVSVPPLDGATVIEVVVVVVAVLVVGRVRVDETGGPEDDADVEVVKVINHLLRLGVLVRVPDKVVVPRRPLAVDVHGSDLAFVSDQQTRRERREGRRTNGDVALEIAVHEVNLGALVGLA